MAEVGRRVYPMPSSHIQYGRSWEKSLSYAEFSYNNSYEESLKMTPFEMLYGWRCKTPIFWNETREQQVFGPDIIQDTEKQVRIVRENIKVAQSCQKSYANRRRRDLSFEVGDYVYLKMLPLRGLHQFKVRGNLAPRFIGPLKILEQKGEMADISIGIAPVALYCTRCVPHVTAEEIFTSTWRTSPTGRFGYERRSYLSRISCQVIGDLQKSHKEQKDSDVQGSVEPPYRRKSHMGKRRRTKAKISKLLCWVVRISRVRFFLRRVGLSHPE
jgi:hypothetical protein